MVHSRNALKAWKPAVQIATSLGSPAPENAMPTTMAQTMPPMIPNAACS